MKIKINLFILMFVLISTSKVFAAATMTCGAKNQLHSIGLGGVLGRTSWLDLNIRNLHHKISLHEFGDDKKNTLYSYQNWYDETEYREIINAGERYIPAIDVKIYFGLKFHLLHTGRLSDDRKVYVGRYEIIVQSGGGWFGDESSPLQFFSVVNVESGDVLNIRAEPNAKALKVGEIPSYGNGVIGFWGAPVRGWVFVNFGGIEGWVSERYLGVGGRYDNEFIGLIECEYGM